MRVEEDDDLRRHHAVVHRGPLLQTVAHLLHVPLQLGDADAGPHARVEGVVHDQLLVR